MSIGSEPTVITVKMSRFRSDDNNKSVINISETITPPRSTHCRNASQASLKESLDSTDVHIRSLEYKVVSDAVSGMLFHKGRLGAGGGGGAELEYLIRKAKVQHDTIERGHDMDG